MSDWEVIQYKRIGMRPAGELRREETPYRECPNCGEHKFRVVQVRKDVSSGFFGSDMQWVFEEESCKNCRYSEGDDD